MSIRLIVGLGNPGRDYAATRHNIGFMVVDAFCAAHRGTWGRQRDHEADIARVQGSDGADVHLLKPLTFMNDSGLSVGPFCRFYRIEPEQVAVIYDELNLPFGQTKLSISGSAGGHHGVASLLQHLGDGFRRFRVGIGPKLPPEIDMKDYVLGKLTPEQELTLKSKTPELLAGLDLLLSEGVEAAMNQLNRRTSNNDDRNSHQETV